MEKNKDYIEAEVISNDSKKNTCNNENIDFSDIEKDMEGIKKAILLKGISTLILPILVFIGVIIVVVSLIMILFSTPFDYIFSALFLFFILKPVYKLIKMFK